MNTINIELFVKSYLETAIFVECDSDENHEFTKIGKTTAKRDCLKFISDVIVEFGNDKAMKLLNIEGQDLAYLAPHCFYLNRNGHGSGFWDRDEFGDAKDILSGIADTHGYCSAYHVAGKKSKLQFE